MTDNIRTNFCATCKEQADRIEALTAENERLREYLDRIAKAWPIEPTEEWIKLTQPYRDMANEGLAKEHTDGA